MYAILLAATLTAPADARVNARVGFTLVNAAREVEEESRAKRVVKPCPTGFPDCKCGCREGGICTCAKSADSVSIPSEGSCCSQGSCATSATPVRYERSTFIPAPQTIEYHSPPPGTVIWHSGPPVQTWSAPPAVFRGGRRPIYRQAGEPTFVAPPMNYSSGSSGGACAG